MRCRMSATCSGSPFACRRPRTRCSRSCKDLFMTSVMVSPVSLASSRASRSVSAFLMLIGTWVAPYSKFTPRSVKQVTTPLGKILYFYIDSIHFFDRDAFGRSGPRPPSSNLVLCGRTSRNFPPFGAERIGRPAISQSSARFPLFPYLPTSLLLYFFTSYFLPTRWGRKPPVRFLDFPPVSPGRRESYFEGVPVQGEAMSEFTAWMQSNWYALGNLLGQFVFLAAGIWFARKILRTMRASQEQVGALLKMSVTGAVADRHWPSPAERPFATASPYWLTPAELPAVVSPEPQESGPSRWAVVRHSVIAWLQTPMSSGSVAP